uniref:Uncharacterized protein n=1 Tax=Arundo donax TaxID=35708 RepID=A0A0A9C3I7_ARUDO
MNLGFSSILAFFSHMSKQISNFNIVFPIRFHCSYCVAITVPLLLLGLFITVHNH